MPVEGSVTDSSIGLGSRSTQRAQFYPSPFFDIAGTYFPETPKALFRFCRYYYYTVGIIGAAVDVHAAYPITDIVINEEDEKLREKWNHILNEKFKIKSFMVEVGKDTVCMGNGFISLYIPFQRFLSCPHCKKSEPIETMNYEFKNFYFQGVCKHCASHVRYEVKDETIKDIDRANLVRWSPENLDIDYNPITGEHHYRYSIPNEVKRLITLGRRHIIEKIPFVFIEAMRSQLPIIFNPKNVYHLKRPSLAEKNMGWGEPALIRILKDTYYLQVLRKAREAVAHQHIVPLWVLFPQPMGELNPYEHLNLAEWRSRIEQEIKTWRQDPNYIPVMPIPLGFQFIGGNFKQLDTTPEIQNLLLNILAGMNMPQEFIYGGLQYSGTSFSIRMMSNMFSYYRGQLLEFLNGWLIPNIASIFSIKPIKVHFTDLKLADDVQKKTLLLALNQQNKISTGTMLSELGLDAKVEFDKLKDELKRQSEILTEQMVSQEKAKAAAMLENIRGQIRSQLSQEAIAIGIQKEMEEKQILVDPNKPVRINPELFSMIFRTPGNGNGNENEFGKPFFAINPVSVPETVQSLANALRAANEKDRTRLLGELESSMPMLHGLVTQEMAANPPGQLTGGKPALPQPKLDMRPQPQQKPPRRNNGG